MPGTLGDRVFILDQFLDVPVCKGSAQHVLGIEILDCGWTARAVFQLLGCVAQQQDVAHRINEIGVKTDQEAQTAMAAIGAATNDKMADMLEAHEGHMVFARQILEQKAKADERFARRFQAIVEKHDKNTYGG